MDRQRLDALKARYPEKVTQDPASAKIEKVMLATAGHKTRICTRCGGTGARQGERRCPVCQGKGRKVLQDAVHLVVFDVDPDRTYMTRGGRLVVVCEGDKTAGREEILVDPRVGE